MTKPSLILVVEDNEANQLLARAVLELEGYEVRIAASGPEVFDELRECVPDLILMDIQLPGQDGLTVTRVLKADPAIGTTGTDGTYGTVLLRRIAAASCTAWMILA